MFRFLCKELLHSINGGDATTTHLYSLQHLSSLSSISACSLQNPSLKSAKKHPSNTTVSYLMNSFGLSLQKALPISTRFQLKTTENSDSVLAFFESHGFTMTQIARIITWCPSLLVANPERILKPKWEFFHGLGLAHPCLFTCNPNLFLRSLEKKIIPSINFLKTILSTKKDIVDAIKFTSGTILHGCNPNLKALKDLGVPESSISKLLVTQPKGLLRNSIRFNEIVAEVKEMGLDPSSLAFVRAIGIMSFTSKETLERKRALYRSLGWSDCDILAAVRKQPYCLAVSDESIKRKVKFFEEKLGCTAEFISARPLLLMFSFEKRIVPRCSVFMVLKSSGIVKSNAEIGAMLRMAENDFFKKYIVRYGKEIPEIVKAFQGKLSM